VQPNLQRVTNGSLVYAEDGVPVVIATMAESGYRFSR
jgi:hypothetical protein